MEREYSTAGRSVSHASSMEPRPFSHGYRPQRRTGSTGTAPFNGATTFQPWIPAIAATEASDLRSPSMEPRPFSHGYRRSPAACRNSSNPSMEPRPFSHGYVLAVYANAGSVDDPSMEPRPFSHGYVLAVYANAGSVDDPSMEPRPFSHGYL